MKKHCFNHRPWFENPPQTLKRGVWLLGMATLLTGCGDLNSQFNCPEQPGVNCRSLDQVNALIDQGQLTRSSSEKMTTVKGIVQPTVSHFNQDPVENAFIAPPPPSLRHSDQVMRLWIAPYVDTHGNYFSAGLVYHVLKPGQWFPPSVESFDVTPTPATSITLKGKDHG